jgi:hypothetical protein
MSKVAIFTAATFTWGLLTQTTQAQLPSSDFFPIGVFAQPKSSFAKWKGRGINTMFQYEPELSGGVPRVTMDEWSAAARAQGLYYMRHPSVNPADDLQDKNLIAWTQNDEPDLPNHEAIAQVIVDRYQNYKAIGPSKPVWVNFAGNRVTANNDYTQWVKGGDWISADWYPFNADPTRYTIKLIGQQLDVLRAASGGAPKKYFAIIEASNQHLKNGPTIFSREPTPDEFRGSVWEAIVHGASGIGYFPQRVDGTFMYDNMSTTLEAEMKTQNARITTKDARTNVSIGGILNLAFNPAGKGFSTPNDPDLEATWRVAPTGDYFAVLNQSSTPAGSNGLVSFNLAGVNPSYALLEVVGESVNGFQRVVSINNGVVQDTFGAYGVHVYRAAPGIVAGVPVPEPASAGLLAGAAGALALRRPRRRHVPETR